MANTSNPLVFARSDCQLVKVGARAALGKYPNNPIVLDEGDPSEPYSVRFEQG